MNVINRYTLLLFVILLLTGGALVGCGNPPPLSTVSASTPVGAPEQAATNTAVPTQTPTPIPTDTQTPTPIPPTDTPSPQPQPTATETPEAPTETPAPEPSPTSSPEPIASPSEQPSPQPGPTPTPPSTINGMPYSDFILMDEEVKAHVKEIYAQGQQLGRNPNAFSKLGDSLIANPYFLRVFDQKDPNLGPYYLGDYAYLQDAIDYYSGSYDRYGVAIHVGLHTWSVFDPMWASKKWCNPGENLLDCEIRLNNPSVMLVLLGTNDDAPQVTFEKSYDQIVKHLIDQGIVPILFTKADRFEGPDNRNNISIKKIAEKYQVPLVDFDNLANTIPNRGIGPDGIHLSVAPSNDYRDPNTFRYGNTVHNLATLVMLERVQSVLSGP